LNTKLYVTNKVCPSENHGKSSICTGEYENKISYTAIVVKINGNKIEVTDIINDPKPNQRPNNRLIKAPIKGNNIKDRYIILSV